MSAADPAEALSKTPTAANALLINSLMAVFPSIAFIGQPDRKARLSAATSQSDCLGKNSSRQD